MSRKALGEAVLSAPFRNELERILDARGRRNSTGARTVSRETYAHRRQALLHGFAELQRLGYRLSAPTSLRDTHVRALVRHWVEQGKQAATIQNHLSVLRLFAEWIGKRGMVRDSQDYVEESGTGAPLDSGARERGVVGEERGCPQCHRAGSRAPSHPWTPA